MPYSQGQITLLSNASATGSAQPWPGGRGVFSVTAGTFSGATVKLQFQVDGTNWQDADQGGVTFCTMTAAGSGLFELPPCNIRAFISGSPTGLYAYAQGVQA